MAKVSAKKNTKKVSKDKKVIVVASKKNTKKAAVSVKVAIKSVSKVSAKAKVQTTKKKAEPKKKVLAKAPAKKATKSIATTKKTPLKGASLPLSKTPKKSLPTPLKATASKATPSKASAPAKNTQKVVLSKLDKLSSKQHKPINVPKIKTKTSVPYQPEYTNSILDAKENSYKNQVRYSDADLKMFKQIILDKLEASKSELAYLQGVLTKKDEEGFYDSDNKNFSIEEGGIGMEKEQLTQMARRQVQFIDHLEKALVRIENKTYGICVVTGKLIDKERLKAVPHARLSLEAKLAHNNQDTK